MMNNVIGQQGKRHWELLAFYFIDRYLDSASRTFQMDTIRHGILEHIRSDNGPEFTARVVRQWLGHIGVKTLFIEPGSPWEKGYNESFNGKLRDEMLNREVFFTLKVVIEKWRLEYNTIRPHSSLNGLPPPRRQSCRLAFNHLS